MIVGVFGLRDWKGHEYNNYEHVADVLDTFSRAQTILSGGGKGIEQLALRYATDNDIEARVIPPNIQKYGQAVAFTKRNQEIIKVADVAVIFWDGEDRFYVDLMRTVVLLLKHSYVAPII